MKKSMLLLDKLVDNQSFDQNQKEFISLLFEKSKSIAWCANSLSAPFNLGEELAAENNLEICYNSTFQKSSGLFFKKEKTCLFMLPAFSENTHLINYIHGTALQMYQENATHILVDTVAQNIQFAIVFNNEGQLTSILEISGSADRIIFQSIFNRTISMQHTGLFPTDSDLRIKNWKLKTKENEIKEPVKNTSSNCTITDSVLNCFPIIAQDLIKNNSTDLLEIHETGEVYYKRECNLFKHEESIQTSDFSFLVKMFAQRNGQKVSPPQILNIKPGLCGFDVNIIVSQNGDSRILMHKI